MELIKKKVVVISMKILNFGSCNIDRVFSQEHIAVPGETIAAQEVKTHPGGKGLNQSVALARAGVEVFHAGCIGHDGDYLSNFMQENGVNLKYLKTVEDSTGQAFIQVAESGENSIVIYHGANYGVTRDFVDSVLADFEAGDFLILQNEISEVSYLIDKAYSIGMKIVLNPSPFDDAMRAIDLNKITYLLVNEVESTAYTGVTGTDELIKCIRSSYPDLKVVMTLGGRGCMYFDAEKIVRHPSFKVKAVDTTAAGDTFAGYLIAGICKNKPIETAIKYACAAAAIAVSKNGAASSIPLYSEVRECIDSMELNCCSRGDELINKVKAYFSKNYSSASLEALAKELGYSESYTIRWLKKNMNATFSELLISCRCETAAALLTGSDLPVSEIIDRVGYKNESFFRKVFAEKYGKSPLQYRKASE